MPETAGYALPFPTPNDPSNAPAQFQALAEAVDTALGELAQGDFGILDVTTNVTVGGTLEIGGTTTLSGDLSVLGSLVTGEWSDFDPNWTVASGTAPFIGNGTLDGQYVQLGKIVFFNIILVAGSTTTFGSGGQWQFALPVEAARGFTAAASYRDNSAPINRSGSADCRPGDVSVAVTRSNAYTGTAVSNTVPFTWANADTYKVSGVYQAV